MEVISQGSKSYNIQYKSNSLPTFANKVLLEHSYTHVYMIVYGCLHATVTG